MTIQFIITCVPHNDIVSQLKFGLVTSHGVLEIIFVILVQVMTYHLFDTQVISCSNAYTFLLAA